LSAAEREELQRLERRRTTAQALALRARIVLACAEGRSNTEVAQLCQVTRPTVGKWRQRFLERRLDGLQDEPRPGHPRTVSDADVERVLVMTLETQPANATHWSTLDGAGERFQPKHGLPDLARVEPAAASHGELQAVHRPFCIEKVRDIVGLYMNPPEHGLVLCVDEKS
jgi:transposase